MSIIGILAAAAAPAFVDSMRDERVGSAARSVAGVYRDARSRSIGRGAAVLVRWNSAQGTPTPSDIRGHFTVREAIDPDSANNAPSSSCFINWDDADSRVVASFDERFDRYAPAQAGFMDEDGNAQNFADICFSPRGRTFVKYAEGGAFLPLAGVPRATMLNANTSYSRQILVPPNGVARLVGRVQ